MNEIDVVAERASGYDMEVSHIVTIGCSWTYCQGLPDIINQGWPALVARKFNIPLVNLAVPGIGNDAIHRKTYEYVHENLPYNNKPFFIIGWSQFWRRESWQRRLNDYGVISFPKNKVDNPDQQALLENWSEEDFFRRTILNKLSLISLFENKNIPFLMTDIACSEKAHIELTKKYQLMCDGIKNHMQNFSEITCNLPKLPCGHENIEGNVTLANYTIDEIKNKFDNLTHLDITYLKLYDYIKNSKTHQVHPEWCDFVL